MSSAAAAAPPPPPDLNADTWRHCLSFVPRLELLRVNVCSELLHGVSSAALLPQWRGFVLPSSDRLSGTRALQLRHDQPIDRARAIAILRRRCRYCRLPNCRYVNEFRPRERVCERCERERHLSTFKLVAHPAAHGVTEAEMYRLSSIERGTGKEAVTLYLATDIEAVLQARRAAPAGGSSDSSSAASDSDSDVHDDWDNPKVKKWKARRRRDKRNNRHQQSMRKGGGLGRPFFLEASHLPASRPHRHRRNQKKKNNNKHSFTAHQQQQYDVVTSGLSCLMLAD